MDERLVEFVRGLRAAGLRVSVAEARDAAQAMGVVGLAEQGAFRRGLRSTLVKDASGFAAFDTLFPLYFGSGGPPLQNALESLDPDDQALVKAALEALTGRMRSLLDWLTSGQGPSREQLEALARRLGAERARNPGEARYISRKMLRELGFERLPELLARLREALAAAGLSDEAIDAVLGVVEANRDALAEQIAQQVGLRIARRQAERPMTGGGDLLDTPFEHLSARDTEQLRQEVTRLVARLRSRAALRQKRAKAGRIDPRRTLRANQRYGGVPMELRRRRRRLKPSLLLICDVSTSMRPVAELMLRLIYELSDQVGRARSFAFNDDLQEISPLMLGSRAAEAVSEVLWAIPPGYYATDLGRSLETFHARHLDAVDGRTTVIVLGDGRNNFRDPRVDLLAALRRRGRRLIWLNPEPASRWGSDDSDMPAYAGHCDVVYTVSTLAQLSAAVDRLLAD